MRISGSRRRAARRLKLPSRPFHRSPGTADDREHAPQASGAGRTGWRKTRPPTSAAISGLAALSTDAITGFEWATPMVKMKAKLPRPSQPGSRTRQKAGRTAGRREAFLQPERAITAEARRRHSAPRRGRTDPSALRQMGDHRDHGAPGARHRHQRDAAEVRSDMECDQTGSMAPSPLRGKVGKGGVQRQVNPESSLTSPAAMRARRRATPHPAAASSLRSLSLRCLPPQGGKGRARPALR